MGKYAVDDRPCRLEFQGLLSRLDRRLILAKLNIIARNVEPGTPIARIGLRPEPILFQPLLYILLAVRIVVRPDVQPLLLTDLPAQVEGFLVERHSQAVFVEVVVVRGNRNVGHGKLRVQLYRSLKHRQSFSFLFARSHHHGLANGVDSQRLQRRCRCLRDRHPVALHRLCGLAQSRSNVFGH